MDMKLIGVSIIFLILIILPYFYISQKNTLAQDQNKQSYVINVNSTKISYYSGNNETDVNLTFFITKNSIELKKKGFCKKYHITVSNNAAYIINGTYIIPDESVVLDKYTFYPVRIHYEHIPIIIYIKKTNGTANKSVTNSTDCSIGVNGSIIGLSRYKGLNINIYIYTRNETLYELSIIPETYEFLISNYYLKSFFFVLPLIIFVIIYDSIGTLLMVKSYCKSNIIDKYKGIFYTVYIAYLIILQSPGQGISFTSNIFALLGFILTSYLLVHFLILLWLDKEVMKVDNIKIANCVYIKKYHSCNFIVNMVVLATSSIIIYRTLNMPEVGKIFPLMVYYYMTLRNLVIIIFLRINIFRACSMFAKIKCLFKFVNRSFRKNLFLHKKHRY